MTVSSLSETRAPAPGPARAPAATRTEYLDEPRGRAVAIGVALLRVVRSARALAGRVWRVLSSAVTPAGWLVVLWAALGMVVGLAFGWGEFLIGAWVAIVLLLLATPTLIGRENYEVDFALEHDSVVAGDDAFGDFVVRSPRLRIALPGRIDIAVGDALIDFQVPLLRRGHEHRERIEIPARRRGIIDVGPATTTRTDPLHLLQREFRWADVRTLYIHPVTTAIPSTSVGFIKDLEGSTTRTVTSEDISFHAVREYAAGDAQRNIHWKSTAKTGTLMVRQFEETRRSTISLLLDLNSASYANEDEFEMAVSVIGSLGQRALHDGRDVQAVTSGEVPEFARTTVRSLRQLKVTTPKALLDDLAGVAASNSVVELPAIARMLAETRADTSLAFLVTGSLATLGMLQSSALAFPTDVAVAAVICDPTAEPSLKPMGRTRVLTLGLLDDLRKLLARGARR